MVDAHGDPYLIEPSPDGYRFVSKTNIDLGITDLTGEKNLSFSGVTNAMQTFTFQNAIASLATGSTAVIGVAFASNTVDGAMYITSTTENLGQNVVGFGIVWENESLGLKVTPISESAPIALEEKVPLSIKVENKEAIVEMATENDGKTYTIKRSTDLVDWVPCATQVGNGQTFQYKEVVSGKAFFLASKIQP